MFNNSSKILFMFTLVMGTLISISSSSWFVAWMGLEINLLSFIPLMSDKNMLSTEASLKYFLVQALASAMLLFIFIIISLKMYFLNMNLMKSIMLLTLIMKTGASPFHFWFPNMIEGLSWINAMILMIWQKLAPLILMSYFIIKSIFIMSSILSLISGTIGGINQLSLRKLMAYSSITHLSWMILAMYISDILWFTYFMFYSFLTINLILMFKLFEFFYMNQMYSFYIKSKIWKFILFMNFLSLGGLPPFMGFIPKWMVINSLVNNFNLFLLVIMLTLTLMSLFYYLRLCYSSFMLNNYENNWMFFMFMKKNMILMIMIGSFLNIMGLMIISVIYLLF